jgi:hypothetical protein
MLQMKLDKARLPVGIESTLGGFGYGEHTEAVFGVGEGGDSQTAFPPENSAAIIFSADGSLQAHPSRARASCRRRAALIQRELDKCGFEISDSGTPASPSESRGWAAQAGWGIAVLCILLLRPVRLKNRAKARHNKLSGV